MEQHPIPQNISSYEFRLVGDMTLKQFAQLAGGCLVALIFYASPLPGWLKWPLVFLFVLAGVLAAFVPLQERPLTTWIVAFFKAIYSPTQYLWQKGGEKMALGGPKILTEHLPAPPSEKIPLEEKEKTFVDQVQNLFSQTPPPLPSFQPPRRRGRPPKQVQFTPEITFPAIPEIPNLLVGMVFDHQGKIVEGAILEIRDSEGNPVRALRTNRLGQFRIATPLSNGLYEMETEKEGLEFDIVKVELKGEIVPPIEIRAKSQMLDVKVQNQNSNL